MKINLDDLNCLKVREIIQLEEMTGESVMAIGQNGAPMGKMLHAVAFILARRENPDITEEDALDIEVDWGEAPEPDPTEAAG